ncbi:hexose transporter protein [Rutstroemia sp. NJR-2017a BBW]|nr:hexose transporter protein [Rutstroemia sp. NJR-2017a BBW]
MTSKAFSQDAFLNPEVERDSIEEDRVTRSKKVSVYDAVAGRISAAGFIPRSVVVSSTRDTTSSSLSAVPPETVLFRSKKAPTRYAESDIYFANERESPTDLPDSDLLKSLHSYTSDFYARATADGGAMDWRSMDETALIGLGILLEEASREILGKTGDLTFTEGEEFNINTSRHGDGGRSRRSSVVSPSRKARRSAKRRRILDDHANGTG